MYLHHCCCLSITYVLPKIDLRIEHVLIGVENRSRFRMAHMQHVPNVRTDIGASFRPLVFSAWLIVGVTAVVFCFE